ncbi:glycine--tRNA ligase [Patescibacteria group bacterium]|jgi:glycyl-tRNA synthetase|nr:glycine--tRNA ligase [Patescibacteria group bacterium]
MAISNEKKMDLLLSLCKRRGFVYPDSDIYGGFANAWDYGPYGTELKNNIRDAWWKLFVHGREDMVGIDTPVIQHPKVWETSGHVAGFSDPLVEDKKTHKRYRLDHLLEEAGVNITGMSFEQMASEMVAHKIKSPDGNPLAEPKQFNLMFKTGVGVTEDTASVAYLRPETAAGMFTAWKNVRDTMRKKLPFGIAQVGRVFRNEITPGNFIFRTREFEQMEIEYFVKPDEAAAAFDMWLEQQKFWVHEVLKIKKENVVYREIPDADRAFYSKRSIDTEYQYPFGQKELYGLANRTDYDLSRHQEASGEDLRWLDQESGERYIPFVIEPTWGLTRTVLAVLCEHLDIDEADTSEGESEPRMVLRLPPRLAPVKAAILPLQKKDGLSELGREFAQKVRATGLTVEYDEGGSIGKRYRRQDEIGTPFCFTLDYQTKEDGTVTVRDRDAMTQERIKMEDVPAWIQSKLV